LLQVSSLKVDKNVKICCENESFFCIALRCEWPNITKMKQASLTTVVFLGKKYGFLKIYFIE